MRKKLTLLLFHLILFTAFTSKAADIILEAENATLNGVVIATSRAGYSGTGYITGFDTSTDKITWTFPATAGAYNIKIIYSSPYGEKGYGFELNGVTTSGTFPQSTVFTADSKGLYQLVTGQNTISITNGWGYYDIDYVQITPFIPITGAFIEAETGLLTGVEVGSSRSGYSGTGYITGFDNDGDQASYNFSIAPGLYEVQIKYASPYGPKGFGFKLNTETHDGIFQQSDSFAIFSLGKFYLGSTENTIAITRGWGYFDIDYIKLIPVKANGVRLEGENSTRSGVSVGNTRQGFSGIGYATSFDQSSDKLSWTIKAAPGLYQIKIRYASPYGQKGFDLSVNTTALNGMFVQSDTFTSITSGKFYIGDEENTITIGRGWGYFDIDYIELIPAIVNPPILPSANLIDHAATPSTKALYRYILDVYGKKVLSGQHDDINYIQNLTGKQPAVGSFDLIEYSPSRREFGSNPTGSTERYINWAKNGDGNGILTLLWHWNAPTDLINQAPDKLWWTGFYTYGTTFNIEAVLADTTSSRYKLIIRDMDSIAVQLKKTQAANVPVLWRPLHEASGGWFWWGAKGPEPFKKLWKIMYDRYTNYHHLHNLIWVYTASTNPAWYPGDEYVDMVGTDAYEPATSSLSVQWEGLQTLLSNVNNHKVVTLSETGNLPDPDKVRAFGTWWSWAANWTGSWIRNQSQTAVKKFYNDVDVITRDELPNWRVLYNTRPIVSFQSPQNQSVIQQGESLEVTANASDEDGDLAHVALYLNGTLVRIDSLAPFQWGVSSNDVLLASLAPGAYSLKVVASDALGAQGMDSITVYVNQQPAVVLATDQPTYFSPANIILTATASDADGSIKKVEFYNDSTLLAVDSIAPYTFTLMNVSAGAYGFTAKAYDNQGGVTTSPIVNVVVILPNVIGADCGTLNGSTVFELNPKYLIGATYINWWYNGYTKSIKPMTSNKSIIEIEFGQWFNAGSLHVGVGYDKAPYYLEFSKQLAICETVPASSKADVALIVYPNPTAGSIQISANKKIDQITIVNSAGKQAYRNSNVFSKITNIVLNAQNPSGIYKILIRYADNTSETKTISLQR